MAKNKENIVNMIEKLIIENKYNNFVYFIDENNKPKSDEIKKRCEYKNEKLISLDLSGKKIHTLHFLIDNSNLFADLEYLNLSNNLIKHLCWYPNLEKDGEEKSFFTALPNLKTLDLSGNDIIKGYDCLNDLKALETLILTNEKDLDLSNKGIKNISFIAKIKDWKQFNSIKLSGNPYINYDFARYSTQISEAEAKNSNNCISALQIIFSDETTDNRPQKIMLLGNHAVGKSTFLHIWDNEYQKDEKKDGKLPSTHLLKIHTPKNTDTEERKDLKDKIFYDFGGQDYYHGINQLFFTENATNILFWCENKNKNTYKEDSNFIDTKTRYYTIEYWLSQLKYIIHRRSLINKTDTLDLTTNPIILIQTFADKNKKRINFQTFNFNQFAIINDFYID
ncbi:MAG: hypothetical protein LBN23_05920, partial [Paludibacter sp.]|nr:hypothetical protein [Paludibacter sp.]